MAKHNEQIVSVLTRAIQSVLSRGLSDPRVKGMISVTDVRLSGDGRNATVMVSVHPEEQSELTMHGLRHAAKHIRHLVSEIVDARYTPELAFRLDKGLKKQADVLETLKRISGKEDSDQ